MASQPVLINFAHGLNQKIDPWQLPIGTFEKLQNAVFTKFGLLQKRNGYGLITNQNPESSYLTTLNGNLTAIGSTVSAFSPSLNSWITKGTLQPCSLSVLPLIRNNLNQTQVDIAVANGMILTVFTETNNTTSATVTAYQYTLADVTTGQNIIQPSSIPLLSTGTIAGSSRAFVVGNYFVIVTPVTVSGTTTLQYVSIPTSNPVNLTTNLPNVSSPQNVTAESYTVLSSAGWDGVTINNTSNNVLVVAYNSLTGGQGVHVATITAQQIALNTSSSTILAWTGATNKAGLASICVDLTVNPNIFYVNFWNPTTTNGYTAAVFIGNGTITQQFAPQLSIATTAIANLASVAQNGSCTLFSEVTNAYSYDSAVPSNYVDSVTISSSGSVGSTSVSIRSVGLASKAFLVDGTAYYLGAFQSPFQPSYFLINGTQSTSASPVITAKLAYQNGGGYITLGLPSVIVTDNTAQIPYLFKDDVEALNTLNNTQQTTAGGIYSQTGINLVSFEIGTQSISTANIANNLHISGGYLGQYDGYLPTEHNFFVWPDSVELSYTAASTVTPTGTFASGAKTITVSSATGIHPGMSITDTSNSSYIPAGTTVVLVNGTTVTISNATTHSAAGDNLSIQGNIAAVPTGAGAAASGLYYYQVTYEWTDNQGLAYRSTPSIPVTYATSGSAATGIVTISVPTLRLTSKVANKVKIVIYRWSFATQVYNQVTSISAPVLNDTTVDSVSFTDTLADANVIGNNILYTTGGVVPDTNGPATKIMTLFDTRVVAVDAENPRLLWISKQVIPNTPVEMSNLFTVYVSPTAGVIESLGDITATFPMDDKLIIFFKSGIYYMNGVGPDNLGTTAVGCSLGNYSQPTFVTSVCGCNNQESIVLTQEGLMFQSDKGIWLLGRNLSTRYIGSPVEDFNSYTVTSANVIPDTNYVLFTLNTNIMLMYDYYMQQWGTFFGVQAASSCIYQGLHTLIDNFGRILQETPGQYLDGPEPVLMSFKTGWINLASLQGYSRFYDFYLLARYLSPHSLLCQVAYDYNSSILHQKLITPNNFSASTPGPFGVPTPVGSSGDREQWRIHAKEQLCQSFKLGISEVFDPTYGTVPGSGFTMSGITANVLIKKATRPIRGSNTAGMS